MVLTTKTKASKFGNFRSAVLLLWGTAILVAVAVYLSDPGKFSPEQIAVQLREFETAALSIYFALSVFRGLSLLPSTPLVLAGTLLFPHQAWLVLAISLVGIVASSAMIYWLSEILGIAGYFESRKPGHVAKIRSRLEHPSGIGFVALWSFFPLVPTDAVCYVAGSIRMNFTKFISAIFLGELILCSIYIFGLGNLVGLGG